MSIDVRTPRTGQPLSRPPGRHVNTIQVVTILALAASMHTAGMPGLLQIDGRYTPFPREPTMEGQTATLKALVEKAHQIVVKNSSTHRVIHTEFVRSESSWMQYASDPVHTAKPVPQRPARIFPR